MAMSGRTSSSCSVVVSSGTRQNVVGPRYAGPSSNRSTGRRLSRQHSRGADGQQRRDRRIREGAAATTTCPTRAPMMRLTDFEALSFDCYGTLIDWEAGIAAVLTPWAREHGISAGTEELLERYAAAEARAEQQTPSALYPEIVRTAMRAVGAALGVDVTAEETDRLASSVA